jgi:hypothetical protein
MTLHGGKMASYAAHGKPVNFRFHTASRKLSEVLGEFTQGVAESGKPLEVTKNVKSEGEMNSENSKKLLIFHCHLIGIFQRCPAGVLPLPELLF